MNLLTAHRLGSGLLVLIVLSLVLLEVPFSVGEAVPAALPQVDKLEHKGFTEKLKGNDKSPAEGMKAEFEMVPIPGGVFRMGSPDQEPGRGADEGPQHPVKIRPFWMGKCEVTWSEFDIYFQEKGLDNGDEFDRLRKLDADAITGPTPPYSIEGAPYFGNPQEPEQPAISMTHFCALEYCRWLSKKAGRLYRLPTEAEWEWAARAGTTTAYSFGADSKQLDDHAWYVKNATAKSEKGPTLQTHKVGTKKPNAWGLFDMYGNALEWCLDYYQKDYYAALPRDQLALSPVLIPPEKHFGHVARGGSWEDEAPRCRSAARRGSDKTWIDDDPQLPKSIWWLTKKGKYVGLRVVRAVDEQENLKGYRSKLTRESD